MFKKPKISLVFNESSVIMSIYSSNGVLESNTEFSNVEIEDKEMLKKLIQRYRGAKVYIFLDSLDQTYNLKTFPAVGAGNLKNLITKELRREYNDTHFKTSFPLGRDPGTKKWNYMFASSPMREGMKNWLEFLEEMPVVVQGIYFLSLESQNFIKHFHITEPVQKKAASKKTAKKKNKTEEEQVWKVLIVQRQNKRFRQIAFSNDKIIFTKMFNQTSEEPDFLDNFKRDLLSIREYLRRTVTTTNVESIDVILVADEITTNQVRGIELEGYKFFGYSYSQTKHMLKLDRNFKGTAEISSENLIIRNFLNSGKRVYNFDIPRIQILRRLHGVKVCFEWISYLSILGFVGIMLFLGNKIRENKQQYNAVKQQNKVLADTLARQKQEKYDIDVFNIRKALETGWFYHLMDGVKNEALNPKTFLDSIALALDEQVYLQSIRWELVGNNWGIIPQAANASHSRKEDHYYAGAVKMNILNPNGDVDTLIRKFEDVTYAIRLIFNNLVQISYLSSLKNLDLYKVYNEYAVDLTFQQLVDKEGKR